MNLERNPNGALEITRKLFGAWHKTMKISSGGLEIKETKTLTSTPVTQSTTSRNLWVISYCVTPGSTNSNWLTRPFSFIYYLYKPETIFKMYRTVGIMIVPKNWEIIELSGRPRHLFIISLKNFHLFKITESIINFDFKKNSN